MKKILITGGSGFIGRNILESDLKDKYELTAPRRTELDCFDDDSVRAYFATHQFDVVIHAAARPGHRNAGDIAGLLLTNSRMMANLLKYQHRWGKLLNMGSGAVYDMRHYQPKMKESYFGTHIPLDEHGYNKYMFGKLLPGLSHVYDFRIFGLFGRYEDYAIRFISNAICKAIFGLPVTLRQNRNFDYLYVNDLMPVLAHFIESDPLDKAFNITPDSSVSLLEIARLVVEIAEKPLPVVVAEEGMGMEYSGDNSLLKKEMGSITFTPLESAVRELYGWYSQNITSLDKTLLLADKR